MLCCFLNASSINRFFPADICIRVAFQYDFSHNNDVIISAMTSQITGVSIVYRLFTGGPWFAPTKGPVTRKMFPFDDFIVSKIHPRERLMGRRKKCSLQVHNLIYSLLLVFDAILTFSHGRVTRLLYCYFMRVLLRMLMSERYL